MRKYLILALLVMAMGISCGISYADEDWSNYESGRNNIRLDGYHGQAGYIAFTDGAGNVAGYLYVSLSATSGEAQLFFITLGAYTGSALGTSQVDEPVYFNVIDIGTTQVR